MIQNRKRGNEVYGKIAFNFLSHKASINIFKKGDEKKKVLDFIFLQYFFLNKFIRTIQVRHPRYNPNDP